MTTSPVRDFRGSLVEELNYPRASVVLLAGVPGAGKSTLLQRLYGMPGKAVLPTRSDDGVTVLDSAQVRGWLAPVLGRLPYRWWRPLVHAVHYVRIFRALDAGGPIVIHDCGTRPWMRRMIGERAARRGLESHLVLLDTTAEEARAGQVARGRVVDAGRFATHVWRWQKLLARAVDGAESLMPGATSATVLDRAAANAVRRIRFTGPGEVVRLPRVPRQARVSRMSSPFAARSAG
jgi:predicted kinase